jgi:hypothetical protein
MSETILIEPADEHRRAFARWCLDQDPQIMTTSASGSEVPAALFVDVPAELLEGAYIDGRLFRPALAGFEPYGDGYRAVDDGATPADVVPVNDGAQPEQVAAPVKAAAKKTTARRRTAPKGE